MHEFFCFNRKIINAENASISAISSAALYGKGIFTTLAIIDAKPFLWEKHWSRLIANAEKLKIDLSEISEETVKKSILQTIEINNCIKGRARITLFDESPSKIWHFENDKSTSFLITTAYRRETKNDFRLTVSSFSINSGSPLAGVKSCNYLEKIIALDEAKARGFDEAVQINERGEIVSACMANIFWIKDGKIFTPSLKTGCLRGTMRDFLMEKFDVAEVESDLGVLKTAEAVFLTSAGIGVVQITELEAKKFTQRFGEITQIINI